MGAGRGNGNGNGALARQAEQDWGPRQNRQDRQTHSTQRPGPPPSGLGRRLAGGVISGPRERAALAQATADAARAGYGGTGGGFGQPAPRTVPLRGEFSMENVRWIALYLADNRPFRWTVIPHETRIGAQRFYVEIVHLDYDRTHLSCLIHDGAEFMRFLMDDEMNDAPLHLPRNTPLPAGHRR